MGIAEQQMPFDSERTTVKTWLAGHFSSNLDTILLTYLYRLQIINLQIMLKESKARRTMESDKMRCICRDNRKNFHIFFVFFIHLCFVDMFS